MADNTTGLPVQTLSGQFVETKLVDSGGTNQAAVSAAGRLSVDASGVPVPVTDNAGSLTVDGAVSITGSVTPGTGATNLGKAEDGAHTSGDTGVMALAVRNDGGAALAGTDGDYIPLTTDSSGALRVTGGSGGTQYAEDAASAGGEMLTLAGAVRQDTLGSSTSTDGDYAYMKVNAAGALYVDGSQTTQPVSGTVTANAGTGPFPVSDNGGSLTVDAPVGTPVFVELSDGTTALIGQDTMAASLPVVIASDQSSVAVTPAANSTVDINRIVGAAPSATNPLPVRLTDGAAFYAASSGAPTSPTLNTTTSAALGAGANVDLETADIGGTTGQLHGVDVASTVPIKIIISTVTGGTPTTRAVFFAPPYVGFQWRAPYKSYITRAAGAGNRFRVNITNLDSSVAADVYATFYHDEI